MRTGTIVIVDDDQGVLESMVSMLTIEGYRVSGFSSALAFLDEATTVSIACVITDIRMPRIDGLALIERMQAMGLGSVPVIVVSGHADVPLAVAAMQLGAVTVLEKPYAPARLMDAVALAIQRDDAPEPAPECHETRLRYDKLSPRERVVLSHLLKGSSSKVAAIALGISPRTVDVFRANILRKMKATNLAGVATQLAALRKL